MRQGSWLLQLGLCRKGELRGSLLCSPEARIRPSLSFLACLCDPRCSLSFSGPNLLTVKGKAKSQEHMGGHQLSLCLCPLTSLSVLFCSIFVGFGDFKSCCVQSFVCFPWVACALLSFLEQGSGIIQIFFFFFSNRNCLYLRILCV